MLLVHCCNPMKTCPAVHQSCVQPVPAWWVSLQWPAGRLSHSQRPHRAGPSVPESLNRWLPLQTCTTQPTAASPLKTLGAQLTRSVQLQQMQHLSNVIWGQRRLFGKTAFLHSSNSVALVDSSQPNMEGSAICQWTCETRHQVGSCGLYCVRLLMLQIHSYCKIENIIGSYKLFPEEIDRKFLPLFQKKYRDTTRQKSNWKPCNLPVEHVRSM